ncbi:MAG: acyltransferase [Anaerolineales bacterium]|nr:acyltransferase [Anaerolineales bacterium]
MIPGLDGLRAIAILLVFATHSDLAEFGWVGVQLFFVLSGFLITGILLDMKDSLPAGKYFTKFYGRRFLRIFPLYYFYLAAMAVVAYWLLQVGFRKSTVQIFFDQVWSAVFYVYDIFYRAEWFHPAHFLDHFWSLSVEEQFYILWPLLLLILPKEHLKKLFIFFIFLGAGFRVLLYLWYLSGDNLWFFREPFGLVVYALPFSHLDAFAFGAYISRYTIWRPRAQLLVLALLVSTVGFTVTYFTTGSMGAVTALGYSLSLGPGYQFVWMYTLLNYFFAVLIYCVVRERFWVRFLEMPWLRYLGKISYGMYVYHLVLIWFVWELFEEYGHEGMEHYWIKFAIALFATILVSALSYHFLERPILNLKDRFFSWSKTSDGEDQRPSAIL